MKYGWLCNPRKQGMLTSLSLHVGIIFLMHYVQPVKALFPWQGTAAYTIALEPAQHHPTTFPTTEVQSSHTTVYNPSSKTTANFSNITANHRRNPAIKQKAHHTSKKTGSDKKQSKATTNKVAHKPTAIDQRGLYTVGQVGTKQAGATLSLTGWTWDSVPNPNDPTEECGKIIFEIKVDEYGEVIAIRTIEKTVSPLVEKIYADALQTLTFSKTSSTHLYAPVSTGNVTFILVAK